MSVRDYARSEKDILLEQLALAKKDAEAWREKAFVALKAAKEWKSQFEVVSLEKSMMLSNEEKIQIALDQQAKKHADEIMQMNSNFEILAKRQNEAYYHLQRQLNDSKSKESNVPNVINELKGKLRAKLDPEQSKTAYEGRKVDRIAKATSITPPSPTANEMFDDEFAELTRSSELAPNPPADLSLSVALGTTQRGPIPPDQAEYQRGLQQAGIPDLNNSVNPNVGAFLNSPVPKA